MKRTANTTVTGVMTRMRRGRLILSLMCASMILAGAVNAQQQTEQTLEEKYAGETVIAVVDRINNGLDYRENSDQDWMPAKPKMPLYNGFQVRTETGCKAVLLYPSRGTRVLVNENTEIEIQAEVAASGARPTAERVKLMVGEVYSKVGKGSNYDVETPTSVASVRGTEFNTILTGEGAEYTVIVNAIEVMNQLGTLLLQQSQNITVPQGEAPSQDEVVTLTKQQLQEKTDWVDGVQPTWKLNVVPEGGTQHEMGTQFWITVWAQSVSTGAIDANATFRLTNFQARPGDRMEFSADNGSSWTSSPQLSIVNGQARVMARPLQGGAVDLIATAEDSEPGAVRLTTTQAKDRMNIQLRFTDPNGTGEKRVILELEEKTQQ